MPVSDGVVEPDSLAVAVCEEVPLVLNVAVPVPEEVPVRLGVGVLVILGDGDGQ